MDRRKFIQSASILGTAATSGFIISCTQKSLKYQHGKSPWPLCLNTSTIRPSSLEDKINAAHKSGFDAIEIWINELEDYENDGGNLKVLGLKTREKNLFIPNVIGLWDCMPMDDHEFKESLPVTRERMRRAAAVGSKYIAAIPAPDRKDFDHQIAIKRYEELLKIGREEYDIVVAFEFVGFFKGIYQFGQAAGIAIDTNNPDACLIMDTFHLFRGGSGFENIKKISGSLIANFHINDVREVPPREDQGDKNRIYPGDGILPLVQLLKDLKSINYTGTLSLEMFNKEHWVKDPLEIAQTGHDKILKLIKLAGV